ncbi:hypothetical protein [Streptomyces sp. enrichment culture]|uniref:hypothetical protein n=1 Tax=Streptomyces sp. enrichment culture TaxID=1795815 RepID=UPI003F57CD98
MPDNDEVFDDAREMGVLSNEYHDPDTSEERQNEIADAAGEIMKRYGEYREPREW